MTLMRNGKVLVTGWAGYDSGAELLVNGEALELVFGNGRAVDGRLTNSMVRSPGELSIQVRNSNGRISNTVTVLVVAGR